MSILEKLQKKYFLLLYLSPFAFYCLLIFSLSSLSNLDSVSPVAVPDKIAHILEYTGFGFLLLRLLRYLEPEAEYVKHLIWVLSAALIYGLSDEIHQYYVPNREFSWMDLLADGAGGYLGARLWMVLAEKRVPK
ncbi:VanZ family protein [bacterium]|nr:VanZ family protein [bacterium]